ncbi:MAG TPA: hypothetical protein VK421_08760, partial [Pyrinomonadaceae bacterium]|nr:hypothetical protein [Pyrinomonadaceae bacterium]
MCRQTARILAQKCGEYNLGFAGFSRTNARPPKHNSEARAVFFPRLVAPPYGRWRAGLSRVKAGGRRAAATPARLFNGTEVSPCLPAHAPFGTSRQ